MSPAPGTLAARDRAVIWHPCSQQTDYDQVPPLEVVAAKGLRLTLADGRTVLDAISSWWCKSLGHGHPRLVAALAAQAARLEHCLLANATHEPAVALAERLLALANAGQERSFAKVFYADNGSTAVEVALKLALHWQRQAGDPRRTRFAALANGYHGETVGALSVGDLGLYAEPYRPLLFPCQTLAPVPWRSGPEDPAWLDAGAQWPALEAALAPHADTLAAVVYEPVLQGAGGMRPYSPELLCRLRAWADAHGVLLVADEIAAGLWRCGAPLASHLAPGQAQPDLAVLSKGLTGGFMPLAAVLAPARIHDAFLAAWHEGRAFLHSNTYAGNPLACAVACAALDACADEGIPAHVARHGPALRQGLAEAARTRPWLGGVRGVGMMAAVDLRRADGSHFPRLERRGWQAFRAGLERGALLRPLGDTLYLFPPLNTAPADLDLLVATLVDSAAAAVT
jgi:adenosylmethionine-8-amino-7-oxononanoate aminotransferase